MASRNILRVDVADSYCHVYIRGISKQKVFLEPVDYNYFLSLFRRYLSGDESLRSNGLSYEDLSDSVEVLAYCLMTNHFHLLVYQVSQGSMARLMQRVLGTYGRYFNNKYRCSGPVFESRYKASRITSDEYLMHISRYIHLNPDNWADYPYSSIKAYTGGDKVCWLSSERIADLHGSPEKYLEFVQDYKTTRDDLAVIKHVLANDI